MVALFGLLIISIPFLLVVCIVGSLVLGVLLAISERFRFLAPIFLGIIPCTLVGVGALTGLLMFVAFQYESDAGALVGIVLGVVAGGVLGHAAGWGLACFLWRRWSRQDRRLAEL